MKCGDCHQGINLHFWLKTEVWLSVARFEEALCLSCTEKRIGRPLVKTDFDTRHPINYILGFIPIEEARPKRFREYVLHERVRRSVIAEGIGL